MTSLRKQTLAWILAITALAVSVVGGGFIYLKDHIQTDSEYVKLYLPEVATNIGFKVEAAMKAGYLKEEIVNYLVNSNRIEFNQKWNRLLAIISTLYLVSVLSLLAIMLRKEAKL